MNLLHNTVIEIVGRINGANILALKDREDEIDYTKMNDNMNWDEAKDSLFHTSVEGANANSIIYSLVETAKANNLNVFQYIHTLLLYMLGCKNKSAGIEQLLPWSDFVREHCSGLIDMENFTVENHPQLPV